ncbi:MAG: alpha/beta hydrolase [Candidatus Scatosoma sp.]
MNKAVLYLHGKGGNAREADRFKSVLAGYDVFGLDYKGGTPWETEDEIVAAYASLAEKYGGVALIANSIGAYFSMNALADRRVERAFFISPIVDMERLISDMMNRAGVSETELREKKEIKVPFGETLSWKYLSYVRDNPVVWNAPTDILYGENDNLTPYETVSDFAKAAKATLTVMKNGEHWFHTEEQLAFLDRWLKRVTQ